ncbi:tRNA (N6-threonylcarbamoyladenosine(37)-N6)-methyltransferase TrmO [Phytohalomonas tamaricis]|uniref:tRNA (N6-threonylcarbamoyladenosine(37)-N6)-methyltransferase TrmO n=1 Tax=Phytohalomonas tamaricis TaxID=2081032 RepID=UPI000D0B6A0E|nr:tRNA (N6-threonylcarbamoyladenosine(37)-N6)-methyltransferase TrmO [Phytohalomonas tamaricis]
MSTSQLSPFTLAPIGIIEDGYPDKFGVPRQPGLAPSATATLRLLPPFDHADAVRGLEQFSHLWLTFVFHHSPERWTPLVRPPRLGGNAKIGVFASRATHRPNRLGLSLVELTAIETQGGIKLLLRGHDLIDGTPILDIKPYLPWADHADNARAGFAPEPPPLRCVSFSDEARQALAEHPDGQPLARLIEEVLAQDPRPAYHRTADTSGREYGVFLRDVNVRFRALEGEGPVKIHVISIARR